MPKTERACSVSGVPCEMPVWGNAERWRVWVNEMGAAGGRVCAKNPKPSRGGLV
jgi:hypothetical protein